MSSLVSWSGAHDVHTRSDWLEGQFVFFINSFLYCTSPIHGHVLT